ncbi:hypothetical protein KBD34_02300 [Patescibacteria group bacterium]|nr:hypothetical protein [Patescibacteria group bacterium]
MPGIMDTLNAPEGATTVRVHHFPLHLRLVGVQVPSTADPSTCLDEMPKRETGRGETALGRDFFGPESPLFRFAIYL